MAVGWSLKAGVNEGVSDFGKANPYEILIKRLIVMCLI